MKTRIISALFMILLLIPIMIIGGSLFQIAIITIGVLCLKEIIDTKSSKKNIPLLVKTISYMNIVLLLLVSYTNNFNLSINLKLITALFTTLLLPIIIYHNYTKYNVEDAFFLIGSILFLGISLSLLTVVRYKGLSNLIYLLLITTMTDTYAYITGVLIGKHKLSSISPKKTWEGTIGGTILGVGIASSFYLTVVNPSDNMIVVILITLLLSVLGQFGDLIFSSIKRYYDVKDFSNIIPGHGGILDRLDSIILVILGYMLFINIL